MRRMAIAVISGIGFTLLGTAFVSASTANMSLVGKPAAAQSLIVQAQANGDAKRCARQCRRVAKSQRAKCNCECAGGFWWYPNGPCW